MKPLKSQIKKDASLLIEASIESIFVTLHKKYKTTSGDISPMQNRILSNILEELPLLMAEQIFQNIDFENIKLEELTREELIELAYSFDSNGSWDADEEGQEPITKEELIEQLSNIIFQNY